MPKLFQSTLFALPPQPIGCKQFIMKETHEAALIKYVQYDDSLRQDNFDV